MIRCQYFVFVERWPPYVDEYNCAAERHLDYVAERIETKAVESEKHRSPDDLTDNMRSGSITYCDVHHNSSCWRSMMLTNKHRLIVMPSAVPYSDNKQPDWSTVHLRSQRNDISEILNVRCVEKDPRHPGETHQDVWSPHTIAIDRTLQIIM